MVEGSADHLPSNENACMVIPEYMFPSIATKDCVCQMHTGVSEVHMQ